MRISSFLAAVVAGLVCEAGNGAQPSIKRDQDGFRGAPATLDARLVHCQLGAGLHVQRLRKLEGKVAVGARVHVDGAHGGLVSPKPERRSGEPAGRGGQARVVDIGLTAAAAPNVAALAFDDRPASLLAAADRKPPIYRLLGLHGLRGLRGTVQHEFPLEAHPEGFLPWRQQVDVPERVLVDYSYIP